ncbi:MAG: protein kinase, partial [bacterium]
PSSDFYSVGMVLYHMLTGFPVFHDSDKEKVRFQQVYVNPAPHIEYYKQIPSAVKEILITALQKDPSKRYSSLAEFKEAVAYALAAVSFKRSKPEGSLVGETIDNKYETLEELGSGQFSSVYKALEKGRDKFVAIKLYDEKLSREADFIRAINKDLYHRAQLKQNNVPDLIAQGWHGNRYFIVETYVPSSLSAVLEARNKLTPEQSLKLIRKILVILEFLSTKGVLQYHGELSPDHILLNPAVDEFFLKDFRLPETSRFIRQTYGVPPSSYAFMAPEVLLDEDDSSIDQRADIYSLGCLLYRLVTGELLFDGTPEEVMAAHLNAEALPKIQEKYEIPLVFHDLLIKMLEKDQENRYQSYADLAADIDHLIGTEDSGINIHLIDQGTIIKGKYRLEERITKLGGAFGPSPEKDLVIYRGVHLTTDTPVMLWFYRFPKAPTLDESWDDRMKKASEFDNPGLIRVLDFGRDKGAYFFVSELRTHTVADYIDEHGPLTESQAVDVARQVAETLKYLKTKGFSPFRRLSPESVFLVTKPQLKAKLSGLERDIFYDSPFKLNRHEYLSPEAITGLGEPSTASDIYSWALLVYYLISGKDLFHGDAHEIAGLHVYHDPKPELEASGISVDLRRILEHALIKDFTSRFQSWEELLEELDDYQASVIAAETEETTLSFIPGIASYSSVMESGDEEAADAIRTAFAMRYPASAMGVRAAFAVASGIGSDEEALRCADLAIKEAEKVYSYTSLSRMDILDDPGSLAVTAIQRANGVVNQEAFRLNKIGSVGAELIIASISQNRLFLTRVGSGFAYLMRSQTLRTFLRRSDEKRMLGRDLSIQPDTAERHIRSGDILVVGTSDLGRILSENEIRNCITSTIDTQEACERIISLASSRYKSPGTVRKEAMGCIVVQFGEVAENLGLQLGRFPIAPVIHHYVTRGTAYLEEGMIDKAIIEFLKGLEIKPDSFAVNFQIALAYKKKGQLELALKHCRKSLDLFPGFADGHIRMGDILYERGDKDKAREEYETAVFTAPGSAEVHNAMGSYYFRESLYSQAVRSFRKAIELDENNEKAKANLELAVQRAKSITGAVAQMASSAGHGIRKTFVRKTIVNKKKKKK